MSLLTQPLGLRSGECYALLVQNEYLSAEKSDQHVSRDQIISWLREIESKSLACETAEWVASKLDNPVEKLEALKGASHLAAAWLQGVKGLSWFAIMCPF